MDLGAFFRNLPYVKPMTNQTSHGLFFGCLHPMTELGVGQQPLRAMATRAPTLHETTQHSIGLMLIWSFIAVTVLVTAFPFFAVFH